MSIKRLINKLFSSKRKLKKNSEQGDLVFDAVPDTVPDPVPVNKITIDDEASINKQANEFRTANDIDEFTDIDEDGADECSLGGEKNKSSNQSDEKKQEHREFKRQGRSKNKKGSVTLHQNNVNITGTNIHIGNTISNVWNMTYNGQKNVPEPAKSNKESRTGVERTKEIDDLFKCNDKLELAHIEFLSNHIGNSWKNVGAAMGLTTGELECIENQYGVENLKENSFQVLKKWLQKTGDSASVGKLCKLLWKANKKSAQEAVKQLSLKIEDFK